MRRLVLILALAILGYSPIYADISKKALKEVKREVKTLQAEGWQSAVAGITIEEQAIKVREFTDAKNSDGTPIYIVATADGKSVRDNVAQTMALSRCKSVAAQSAMSKDSQIVKAQLGRTMVLMKLKREVGHNVEVRVSCAFKYAEISILKE